MIAAVYCRKSTDQSGISDDQKSMARQLDHARQYAERKGWTVADEHIYVDDGISSYGCLAPSEQVWTATAKTQQVKIC